MQEFHKNKYIAKLPSDAVNVEGKFIPYSIRVLFESLHRKGLADVSALAKKYVDSLGNPELWTSQDIPFYPSRVLMQDFTGVPAIVDLAAMRDEVAACGGDPEKVNPHIPVDLVIDHSIMVDFAGSADAINQNTTLDYQRNQERYAFLKWGQKAFRNFRVVPPGQGICHQVNLEQLAFVVMKQPHEGGQVYLPDVVVGTDSHTTMINGLGVLGWGVGGIEAEAAMLGKAISLRLPRVVGVHVHGAIKEGVTATDIVLTLTSMLRKKGVVGCFVEFFGEGLNKLTLADRATLANMAPEYGATCGFFPVDEETINYLRLTGRFEEHIQDVESYCKNQGLWRTDTPSFHETVELDLGSVVPTLAGPKRPQDQVPIDKVVSQSLELCQPLENLKQDQLNHHDVVLAAITSCTNTSNPALMIAAGLVARKARALGLKVPSWVKTSFAPGSKVVKAYLEKTGLLEDLEALGFHIVGYGCTTCIGNSGPLEPAIADAIEKGDLQVAGVLSGNRNFEGRIHPHVKLNYLASPPLVVVYALAGTMLRHLADEPIQQNVKMRDIWPSSTEIQKIIATCVKRNVFEETYNAASADQLWEALEADTNSILFDWDINSTYIQKAPFAKGEAVENISVKNARVLAVLGDSITTDHISPAGSIKVDSPAGAYLHMNNIETTHFNSYGARRGNHEVMLRGTFANIRLQNKMVSRTGGWTVHYGGDNPQEMTIFDAAMAYHNTNTPLVVFAGKEYGTGSSRDWAAKGTLLLGVKAVIAESFERIHRSNLVGMGVVPLEWKSSSSIPALQGDEHITLEQLTHEPGNMDVKLTIHGGNFNNYQTVLRVRIDTADEWAVFKQGGIIPSVVHGTVAKG